MNRKMYSFLLSIGIEDPERFDMDFSLAGRNPKNPNQVDMFIQKDTPWDYALLDEFLNACTNIRYPYYIRFCYIQEVTLEDVVALYEAYTLAHPLYAFPSLKVVNNRLVATLGQNEEEKRLLDFKALLSTIQYPSDIEVKPMENEPKEAPLTPEEQGFVPKEEIVPPEEKKEDIDGRALIAADLRIAQQKSEEELLEQEQENLKVMMEERNRARVNKKGDYQVAETLEEVFRLGLVNVDFCGEVFEANVRGTRKGGKMGVYGIGDATNAITIRAFANKRGVSDETLDQIKVGDRLRVRGAIDIDQYTKQKTVRVHFLDLLPPLELRKDDPELPKKRVELHLHTKMSSMDGVADFASYYKLAKNMGMTAIAVTDHGVLQSFPAAQTARERDKKDPLKVIYGCELYLFDRQLTIVSNPCSTPLKSGKYCVFDTETTGLSAHYDRVVEFGGVVVENGMVVKRMNVLINPEMHMPEASSRVNHITDDMLAHEPKMAEVIDRIIDFMGDNILVAHNAIFDISMMNAELARLGRPPLKNPVIDTLSLSHYLFPKAARHTEGALLRNLGLAVYDKNEAHRAEYDATALSEGWEEIIRRLNEIHPGFTVADFESLQVEWPDIDDVERKDADEKNRERFLRAMNRFAPFFHFHYPKDEIKTHFDDFESAHEEYRRWAYDPNPEEKELKGKPELFVHFSDMKMAFNSFCRNLRDFHVTVLVKNQAGLKDLYKIVTQGNTTYLARYPKTPRDLLSVLRKNLLVGSSCFNSEIFEIARTRGMEDLAKAMEFYDYIEIQPLPNYSFLLNTEGIDSEERLIKILRDIITAAKMAGKKVVVTGDCHYVNPEDKIYRDIYIHAMGIGNGRHPLNPEYRVHYPPFDNPDQHFRSTREMLDLMEKWMSKEEAEELVIENSNWVADQIDAEVIPVSPGCFPPNENLPNSAQKLNDLCYGNFHATYDYSFDEDPKVLSAIEFVKERLDRELGGIIGHGYAVTYYIAHKLIKMANDEPEHYIVGSRGSVGSSIAATMANITEVNPLPPHYHCPHCHYLTFEDEDGVNFLKKGYKSGFDLPEKTCPKCGTPLKANGQNIPFETFLGFSANKVPDIDLNFEEDSQHKAHNYTRMLLGDRNVFRAGTIETVAEKTAYGFVRGFFEDLLKEQHSAKTLDSVNPAYIAYLASKCTGVKRTTGQHPGGIVVVPSDRSVYDFTAVQHPADDLESDWLTTHFDYRSMHDELLKFDILGHVDPMAMRYYRDLTGVKIEDIPMNDPRVLSLFTSPAELHLGHNYLGVVTGASALPEFGTDLAQRMLSEAQPKTFNDLLIISGLSHGTDVWAGNAEDLILNHVTDINGVIGCRDDIMSYLILQGIEPGTAFAIMEDVRHGKFAKTAEKYVPIMQAHNVPQWYIDSCLKIKYLFPRGHATAYVMMAVRVAYFKLYYPLQFYAVFFSVRSDAYDIETMIAGEEAILKKIQELRARREDRANPLSNKEINILKTLIIALEMCERGYHFSKIDLYRSDFKMFVVDEENKALIPPFTVIDQLGENAGKSVVDARNRLGGRPFLSKEQLLRETKLSSTNLAELDRLGALEDLSETNQMTLF
ncbi:MAG: PolC-type DNA polymerase III [Candidatus Enteromonas sp.]|nr:PolC-type DNA polymerase III [Candidatus Enteromonas sp.]